MESHDRAKAIEARRCSEVLRDLVRGYRARMEDQLRGTGVTLPQIRMLKAIREQAEVSAAKIARHCQVTPQTLQTMLARATREGWIVRGSSERNNRIVTASLTPLGEELLARGLAYTAEIERILWEGVSEQELAAMRHTLEQGLGNLNRA